MAKHSASIEREGVVLNEFRAAYIALVNATKLEHDYDGPKLRPKVSSDKWSKLQRDVAIAAGAAQAAYLQNGGATFSFTSGRFLMNNVNPLANWQMTIERPDEMEPQNVVSAVDLAIGRARARYEAALQSERGLVGLIASFLRWPDTLRQAVGPSRTQRTAASALGVVGQVVVGAVAAALGTALVWGVVELWQLWF